VKNAGAVFIGFQEQGNLGLGYIAAMLAKHGFTVRVLDFRERQDLILDTIRIVKPALVGFSLIFQYYTPKFRELASYLRDRGVACHFCAGGHYPSLRYEQVLRDVPELDSVIRFEGELTVLELMECLVEGRDWHTVEGIAYRDGDRCLANPPRPLIADLDALPFPLRPFDSTLTVLGKKLAPILASRGCSRNCSFCSIRQFYGQAPGKKVRVRKPAEVVAEMRTLHEENGVSIFLFQDDDFPVWGQFGRRWISQFIESLGEAGLCGRVVWKISCRGDEVQPELFSRMRDAGLFVVYLGIESGNEAGLQTLNKRLTAADSLHAASVLQDLDLSFTYGFMLFDPSSTFGTVRQNVAFLSQLTAGGVVPVVFCRMLPYAATPIEARLAGEGRLRGSVDNPDYDFVDLRLNPYFYKLNRLVAGWMQGSNGLVNQLNFAWLEYWVMRRLFPLGSELEIYERFLRSVTGRSNQYLLDLVEQSSWTFEKGNGVLPSLAEFQRMTRLFAEELLERRDAFILRHQDALLAALQLSANQA